MMCLGHLVLKCFVWWLYGVVVCMFLSVNEVVLHRSGYCLDG